MSGMQIFDLVAMTITFTALVRPIIHALQRNNYRAIAIWNILFTRYYKVLIVMQIVMFAVVISPISCQSIVLAVGCVVLTAIANRGRSKLPLRYTARAVRLFGVCLLAVFGVLCCVPSYIVPVFLPLVVLVSLGAVLPIELAICRVYWVRAHHKLCRCTSTKIAVTGSYGKTSVKAILAHLLDGIATPSSYNTPMGIAKFVNSTDIDKYNYIVLEMGARHRGDIAKLCTLCQPDMGVVVGVAPQHVATLGGMAGVISVKQELLHGVGTGQVVLSGYDTEVASWTDIGNSTKVVSTDIIQCTVNSISASGSTLDIVYGGNTYMATTALVGVAHCQNIALALAVCIQLGIDIQTLLDRVATLPIVPHRMQYIAGTVDIIDDSYNANLVGVQLCCQSVSAMHYKTKIAIAQGIVECGEMSHSINKQVGHMLGEAFDIIVLVGQNSSSMAEGISSSSAVLYANSTQLAVEEASQNYTDNCLLVFNNDIP